MIFQQYASGSSGNLYEVVAQNGKRLLIEAGLPWKKLQKALKYDLTGIVGCFVSHLHKDHSKALADVRKAGIEVFASKETLQSAGITGRRVTAIENKDLVKDIGGFQVYCFDTLHDVDGALGFVIYEEETKEHMLFCTDSFYIKPHFRHKFSIIALEVSYDKFILQERQDRGDIIEALATRLLISHQEKQTAIDYPDDYVDLSHCRQLHLLHMSSANLDKEQTVKEFEDKFAIEVVTV